MYSFHWDEVPMLRLLLPLIAGILIAIYTQFFLGSMLVMLWIALPVFIFIKSYAPLQTTYSYRWLFGVILTLFWGLCGYELTLQNTHHKQLDFFANHLTDSSLVVLQVNESLVEKEKTYKAEVKVKQVINTARFSTIGKAIVYFQKDSLTPNLQYGDVLLVNNKFREIAAPKNPYEFDYKQYMQHQNIYHQAFLKKEDWTFTQQNEANFLFKHIYSIRSYLLTVIQENLHKKEEIAIASALLLGYKELLEKDVKETYAHTGAMHILAVSGLHVGIIYMIINLLIGKLKNNLLKVVILLTSIWLFALIAGLPPSVCRASLMFSLFVVGEAWNQRRNMYNMLATSAFILLLINPYMITYVGFQLSYVAVTSIVFFQRKFYNLWLVENLIGDRIWQLTTVSLAAQIGTLPLSLYYFHQFPSYFLVANIIVIPAAGFILGVGLLLFAVSFIPILATIIGSILQYTIELLNFLLLSIQQFPLASIGNINISPLLFYLLYGLIFLFALFFLSKNHKVVKLGIGVLVGITCLTFWQKYQTVYQQQLTIYHLQKGTAIDFVTGEQATVFIDETSEKAQKASFHILPNHVQLQIKETTNYLLTNFLQNSKDTLLQNNSVLAHYPFLQFGDKRLLILPKQAYAWQPNTTIKVDYLLLTQNTKANLAKLSPCLHFDKIIIDASNNYWRVKKWRKQCEELGLSYYDINEKGAFVVNVNQ